MQKENVVICPPCGENVAGVTKEGQNKENTLWSLLPRLTAVLPPQGREMTTWGFTLIELLVVVLIIGILAAVAVPQYQRAVEKSKASHALPLLKSVYQAAKAYKLANGTWPQTFGVLDVAIPWTGTENWQTTNFQSSQGKSNGEWTIQLHYAEDRGEGVVIGRLSGPYQGIAFEIYDIPRPSSGSQELPIGEIICVEGDAANRIVKPFTKARGAYCQQFFKGKEIDTNHANRYYKLP